MAETTDLKSCCLQILRENGFTDEFTNVEIEDPELHGSHFASTCDYITVHRKNGQPIDLFVKRQVENPTYSKLMKEMKAFVKEAGFFNNILPEFQRIIDSRLDSNKQYDLSFVPQCYFANENMIILENLAKRGHIVLDKIERQDLNQAQIGVKTLAKFHAPSYVLLKEVSANQLISKHACLEDSFFTEACEHLTKTWIIPSFRVWTEVLQGYDCDDKEANLNILNDLSKDAIEKLRKYYTLDGNEVCHVINHGDCWNNNMMFLQDSNTKQFVDVTFVDFQVIRVGSPNLDLGFFLFTSVKDYVRRKEWKNLLQLYYDLLVESVEALKGSVDFSFEEFLADYKRKFVLGFTIELCIGSIMGAMEDIGNLNEIEGDVTVHIKTVIRKWVRNNPEIVNTKAEELVNLFREYRELLNL